MLGSHYYNAPCYALRGNKKPREGMRGWGGRHFLEKLTEIDFVFLVVRRVKNCVKLGGGQ